MSELNDELIRRATGAADRKKATSKENYRLAKDYGFTTEEAIILMKRKADSIHELAKERGYAK